jgi:hypothetical protein
MIRNSFYIEKKLNYTNYKMKTLIITIHTGKELDK